MLPHRTTSFLFLFLAAPLSALAADPPAAPPPAAPSPPAAPIVAPPPQAFPPAPPPTAASRPPQPGDPPANPYFNDRNPYPPALWTRTASPSPPPSPPSHEEVQRYYLPILVSDALSMSLVLGSIATRQGGNAALGGINFAITPPIIHMVKDRVGMGFASFGVRLGFPLVTAALLGNICDQGNSCRDDNIIIAGLVIGMLSATALDTAVFAKKTVTVRDSAFSVQPTLATRPGSTTVGLTGAW